MEKNFRKDLSTNLILIFNTHIPYVLHDKELFNEQENWIFESITETYITLLNILSNIEDSYKNGNEIVFSITPCTLQQLIKGKERYLQYLSILKSIALSEVERTSSLANYNKYQKHILNYSDEDLTNLNKSAKYYLARVEECIKFYENNDIIEVIKNLNNIKLWTSTPNHNFLPMHGEKSIEYFVKRGIEEFENIFKKKPDGFWLPECAYYPGIEKILVGNGITSTALNINAVSLYTGNEKSGVYEFHDLRVLIHDFRVCKYLWKAPQKTIPSNPVYREFYRDMGFDVTQDYINKFGIKIPEIRNGHGLWTGFKYFAVSEPGTHLGNKKIYDITAAEKQAKLDAPKFYDYLDMNRELVNDYQTFVLAFDTEFFGHWWFEGPWWLREVLTNGN